MLGSFMTPFEVRSIFDAAVQIPVSNFRMIFYTEMSYVQRLQTFAH
jgi:hypothetical protein